MEFDTRSADVLERGHDRRRGRDRAGGSSV